MRSRFLNELPTPEIEAYFARGGDTALLPFGSLQMHGPHLPVGCDCLIARGFCLRAAEKLDALVLPDVAYTWIGASDNFPGSISLTPELSMQMVDAVLEKAAKSGFKRIAICTVLTPAAMTMGLVARRFFEKHLVPVVFFNIYTPLSDEVKTIFASKKDAPQEASVLLASLKLLGMEGLYDAQKISYADQEPPLPQSYRSIKPAVAGYFYQDPRQHVCPMPGASAEKGLKFMDVQIEKLPAMFEAVGQYAQEAGTLTNTGTWKQS